MRRMVDSRLFVDTDQIALLTFDPEKGDLLLLYGMRTPVQITPQQAIILFRRLMGKTKEPEEGQYLPAPKAPIIIPSSVDYAGVELRRRMYGRLNARKPPFVRDENGDAPPATFFSGDWIPEAYAIQESNGWLFAEPQKT